MTGIFTSNQTGDYQDPESVPVHPHPTTCQVVGVFDSNNTAHIARDALIGAGVPRSAVHVMDRVDPSPAGSRASLEERRSAWWKAVGSLFDRTEHANAFHLVPDPKHAIVVVTPHAELDITRARQVLRSSNPVEVYDCKP